MSAYTAFELAKTEPLPAALTTSGHLVWNSPATIDFNSPGAQGFGVKRAGLTIPGSLMLLISPAACGRNTNALTGSGRYGERFAYLELTSTDIVTGAHLSKIPEAARLFLASRTERPSCLLLCTTCVDALLGTDMERICRKVETVIDVPVRPCYMYALTRESLHPPMVHVRETIYSLLAPRKKHPRAVNLLGFFSPIDERSELFDLLRSLGIETIRQLATCKTYGDFQAMAEANFNLVLSPEALPAAEALANRLKIPYITLDRFYTPGRIHHRPAQTHGKDGHNVQHHKPEVVGACICQGFQHNAAQRCRAQYRTFARTECHPCQAQHSHSCQQGIEHLIVRIYRMADVYKGIYRLLFQIRHIHPYHFLLQSACRQDHCR